MPESICRYHWRGGKAKTLTTDDARPDRRGGYDGASVPNAVVRICRARRVTLPLEVQKGVVKLTLLRDELPDAQSSAGWRAGWAPILSSLQPFLESGRALPQLRSLAEKGRSARKARG